MKYLFFVIALVFGISVAQAQTAAVTVNTSTGAVLNTSPNPFVMHLVSGQTLYIDAGAGIICNGTATGFGGGGGTGTITLNGAVSGTGAGTFTTSLTATSSQIQAAIGSGVYDASGAASALLTANNSFSGNNSFTGTNTFTGTISLGSTTTLPAANISSTLGCYLTAGFTGLFLSGYETGFIMASTDGTNWFYVPGFENYSPPGFTGTYTGTLSGSTITGLTGISPFIGVNATVSSGTYTSVVTAISGTTATVTGSYTGTNTGTFSFVQPVGIRDCDLLEYNGGFYVASTTTANGSVPTYGDVAYSPDLVNWTHLANTVAGAAASPKWFMDTNGSLYIDGYGNVTAVTSLSPAGISLGTPTAITFTSSYGLTFGDIFITKQGSTYILYASSGVSPNAYHVLTASSITGPYTDQGIPAGWPTGNGLEGVRGFTTSAGLYRVDFSNGTFSTSTTPTVPSSWSAFGTVNFAPNGTGAIQGVSFAVLDNGGGFWYNDSETGFKVLRALQQNPSVSYFPSSGLGSKTLITQYPLSASPKGSVNGIGSITSDSRFGTIATLTVTGGQLTQQQILPGTVISCPSTGAAGVVRSVTSSTVMNARVGGAAFSGAWTFVRGSATLGGTSLSTPEFYLNAPNGGTSPASFDSNLGPINLISSGDTTGANDWLLSWGSGYLGFRASNTGVFSVRFDDTAGTADLLHVTQTGVQMAGTLVVTGTMTSGASTAPSYSSVVNGVTLTVPAIVATTGTTTVSGIVTGTNTLYTVPTGKHFHSTELVVTCTAAANITSGPTINVYTASAGDIYASNTISALQTANQNFTFGPFGMSTDVSAAGTIKIALTTASTGTATPSQTLKYDLYGTLY